MNSFKTLGLVRLLGEQVNNPNGTGDYKVFEVKKENGTTKYRIGEYTWVYDSDANCEYTEY